MTNIEKYNNAFKTALGLEDSQINDELVYQGVVDWDSVGHMELISQIEDSFDIMMDTDDIIDFSSYAIGKEILKKYKVEL